MVNFSQIENEDLPTVANNFPNPAWSASNSLIISITMIK